MKAKRLDPFADRRRAKETTYDERNCAQATYGGVIDEHVDTFVDTFSQATPHVAIRNVLLKQHINVRPQTHWALVAVIGFSIGPIFDVTLVFTGHVTY
jgi:hypothetical protein